MQNNSKGNIDSVDEVAALRAIVEGTARATGEEFFRSLVRTLAAAIDVQYAFVAEFTELKTRVRTRAFWAIDRTPITSSTIFPERHVRTLCKVVCAIIRAELALCFQAITH